MTTDAAGEAQPTPEQKSAEEVKKTAESISSAVRSVWLAFLGVPVAAAESGKEVFHYLVEKGEKVESQGKEHFKSASQSAGRAVESVTSTVGETVRDIGGKARSFAGKSEEAIDQKIAERLKSMGVPTKKDLQSLSKRVDQIAEKLAAIEMAQKAGSENEKEETP
jgi:poly(hydroxyalkanoate) granule-associated protein